MLEIFILLIAFQIKHFIADYPLQFPYMYEAKGMQYSWAKPLRDHALVHMTLSILIAGAYSIFVEPISLMAMFVIAIYDFTTHFVIDRIKATQQGGPDTSRFWINLGLDQMAHHIVGIVIVFIIINDHLWR